MKECIIKLNKIPFTEYHLDIMFKIEDLNRLNIPNVKLFREDATWNHVVDSINESGYTVTIGDAAEELLFDFSIKNQKPFNEILNSPEFNMVYEKNWRSYVPSNLGFLEPLIEKLIYSLTIIGYKVDIEDFNYVLEDDNTITNCTFAGTLNISKFLNLNDHYAYTELSNAINNGFVKRHININSDADNFSFVFIDNSSYCVLDQNRLAEIIKVIKYEYSELCKYFTEQLNAGYKLQFSKKKLLSLFMKNAYMIDKEGNILF